jgi:hypothetical protein
MKQGYGKLRFVGYIVAGLEFPPQRYSYLEDIGQNSNPRSAHNNPVSIDFIFTQK